MENSLNKYVTVAYKLYVMDKGEKVLVEEAPKAHPFQFISGLGYTLERFEKEITVLNQGDNFCFTIPCSEAYGEFYEENVRTVPKSMFTDADGKFDEEHIFEGNVIPLQDHEGHQFLGTVGEITKDTVVIDLNHPHAGKDLTFEGIVIENRPATAKEIEETLNMMAGEGGCGGCCSGCGDHAEEEGGCGCGCGHCH